MFSSFAEKLRSVFEKLPFDAVVWFVWGSFAAIYVAVFLIFLMRAGLRSASKRPFLYLVNAYSAITLSMFLLATETAQAVFVAALFWTVGYILYGALCFFTRERREKPDPSAQTAATYLTQRAPVKAQRSALPPARLNVRLEHAVTVTDKLLAKNLGKGDRQELEKLKNTLAVLRVKGTLTPSEAEILNENFNTLLKLMAKYDV